jgi:hypothetical protein
VRLGRRIYDNLRKAMAFIFAVHVPIAGLALLETCKPLVRKPIARRGGAGGFSQPNTRCPSRDACRPRPTPAAGRRSRLAALRRATNPVAVGREPASAGMASLCWWRHIARTG